MASRGQRKNPIPSERYDRDYFLSDCEGFEAFRNGAGPSRRLQKALRFADLRPGMVLLDIGCGRGEVCDAASRSGVAAVGVDYAPSSLEIATEAFASTANRRRAPAFARCDAKTLAFRNDTFDRVTMFDIVEHLHDWELERAFDEVYRVLRPGGKLIVHTMPNRLFYDLGYPYFTRWMHMALAAVVRTERSRQLRTTADPRANFPCETELHVNEQTPGSLRRHLARRFRVRVRPEFDRVPSVGNFTYYMVSRLYPLSLLPGLRALFADEIWAEAGKPGG